MDQAPAIVAGQLRQGLSGIDRERLEHGSATAAGTSAEGSICTDVVGLLRPRAIQISSTSSKRRPG